MRTTAIVAMLALTLVPLTLLAPTAAAACPSYEQQAGTEDTYVALSTDDAALMAHAAEYYVWSDAPASDGWLYYIVLGVESNGVPGPQRADERCDQTDGGVIEPDCGWMCTF